MIKTGVAAIATPLYAGSIIGCMVVTATEVLGYWDERKSILYICEAFLLWLLHTLL